MLNKRIAVLLLAGIFLALSALPASASAPAALGGRVKIVNFTFMPSSITIRHGQTVGWKNTTTTTMHTTTSDTGVWDSGVLSPGQMFKFTFNTPGTFTYHCNIHTFMTGSIVVQ